LNWLVLATLLGEEVPDADALIDRCKATAKERFGTDRKFFTAIAMADAELVRALRSGRLGQVGPAGDAQVVELQTVYQEVIRDAAPNARELHSVGRHIDIIGIVLDKLAPGPAPPRQPSHASPSSGPSWCGTIAARRALGPQAIHSNPRNGLRGNRSRLPRSRVESPTRHSGKTASSTFAPTA
jgi:hypothetical protein